MKCRHCARTTRPCRRFMIAPARPRDVCEKCHQKQERAAREFNRTVFSTKEKKA